MTIRPFSPHRDSPADLSRRTVGRDTILANLSAKLLSAARTRAKPHVLLVGPRGAGKSHLVEVALYRAGLEPDFATKTVVVRIPEDSTAITRYSDLLREILRALSTETTSQGLEGQIAQLLGSRTVVLVIENLDRVFQDIGLEGQRNLRAWVETSGHVLILATTPLLFPAVADRDQPWFGGLATIMVPDLTAAQGQELVAEVARSRGDEQLRDFVLSSVGEARLQAIAALTGGSPRIWMILAGVATKESLDELVPAVEDLLEGLVPYYQQLLWSLSPNERRLVVALARDGAMTVSDVAEATEIDQRTAAKTLGRLAEQRWVVSEKPKSGDRRSTYYRVREPMLRYHLQYREEAGEPISLVVTLLRSLFTARARLEQLMRARLGSISEAYLSAAMGPVSIGAPLVQETDDYAFAALDLHTHKDEALRQTASLLRPILSGPQQDWDSELATAISESAPGDVRTLLKLVRAGAPDARDGDSFMETLRRVWEEALESNNPYVICLAAENFMAADATLSFGAAEVMDRTRARLATIDTSDDHPAYLRLRAHRSADPQELAQIRDAQVRTVGLHHPDTIATSLHLAYAMGKQRHHDQASLLLAEVLPDIVDALGSDHSKVELHREFLELYTALANDETGEQVLADLVDKGTSNQRISRLPIDTTDADPEWARDLRSLLAEGERFDRLLSAVWCQVVGHPESAITILQSVIADDLKAWGQDDPRTLGDQVGVAELLTEVGQPDAATQTTLQVLTYAIPQLGWEHEVVREAQRALVTSLWKASDFATLASALKNHPDIGSLDRAVGSNMLPQVAWRIGLHSTPDELAQWEGQLGDHEYLLNYAKAAAGDRSALPAAELEAFETLEPHPQ